jgi:hypothetical protein
MMGGEPCARCAALDSSGDSNTTAHRATAAHDDTRDRTALDQRPVPWEELTRKRSPSHGPLTDWPCGIGPMWTPWTLRGR